MHEVRTTDGSLVRVGTKLLSHLRVMTTQQIIDCGYDPSSVADRVRSVWGDDAFETGESFELQDYGN